MGKTDIAADKKSDAARLEDGEIALLKVVDGTKKQWWAVDNQSVEHYPYPRNKTQVVEAFKEKTGRSYQRITVYETMKPSEAVMTVVELQGKPPKELVESTVEEISLVPEKEVKRVVTKFPRRKLLPW